MRRAVEPELLDDLPPGDAQARGSRADLRRLNYLMGHAGILARALRHHLVQNPLCPRPLRLAELGAGDGTLMLRVAGRCSAWGVTAHVTLLDRQDLVSARTRREFVALNWSVESVAADVFDWLEQPSPTVDVMMANLFLHHFTDERLSALFRLAAARTNLFIACEPRRSPLALAAARWLWLIGCNATTRHDAIVSVRAGFTGREVVERWPAGPEWATSGQSAGLFSHCFIAKRHA